MGRTSIRRRCAKFATQRRGRGALSDPAGEVVHVEIVAAGADLAVTDLDGPHDLDLERLVRELEDVHPLGHHDRTIGGDVDDVELDARDAWRARADERGDVVRDGLPAGDRRQRDIVVAGVVGEKCGQLGGPDIVGPRRAEPAHDLDRALHLAPPVVDLVGTQLNEIITAVETDKHVKVVVFDSAVQGFFLTHYDFLARLEDTTGLPPGPTGLQPLPDMLVRLSRAPAGSIASIRGRATGVGSELALACDMRFASREKAILSQWEVGAGLVPGGGPMARLPRLMGRGRALEVILSADDIPGDLAELYGYVNRSLPDAGLDGFVDALASRIASFDKRTITDTRRLVNVAGLPSDIEIESGWNACVASMARPATQERIKELIGRGFCKPGDAENHLGEFVGQHGR